ncbi:MAG: hypothetical protein CSA66_06245 [Proteobacteria bacterium]|nr:MAG: hypothetical protein CSA66_06245 [Pseudomonadota bacterium]
MRRLQLAALALFAAAHLAGPAPAHAKNMSGRFALGGEVASNFVDSGLSFRYWVSDFGLQIMTSLGINETDDETLADLGLTLRGLASIARAQDTNLYVAAGITLHVIDNDSQVLDALVGVEHFLSDYFSVSGHVGLHVGLSGNLALSLGRVSSWGSGFHFYF